MATWHYRLNGQEFGPVSFEQLKQIARDGQINGKTEVKHTRGQWTPAKEIPSLIPRSEQTQAHAPYVPPNPLEDTNPNRFCRPGAAADFVSVMLGGCVVVAPLILLVAASISGDPSSAYVPALFTVAALLPSVVGWNMAMRLCSTVADIAEMLKMVAPYIQETGLASRNAEAARKARERQQQR